MTKPGAKTYIALDPGKTTGIAIYDALPNMNGIWKTYEETSLKNIWHLLAGNHFDAIIYERFDQTMNPAAELYSAEVIGILKLVQELRQIILIPQGRAQMKFWTDSKVKTVELWEPSRPHAMDAVRHMLYYLMTAGKTDEFVRKLRRAGIAA